MTDPIDELRRLYEAATGGEWSARDMADELDAGGVLDDGSHEWVVDLAPSFAASCEQPMGQQDSTVLNEANAAFIVHAHNHLPALLAYVRALEDVAKQAEHFARVVDGYDMQQDALADAQDALERARERLGAK